MELLPLAVPPKGTFYPHPCSKLPSAMLLLGGANMVVLEEEKLELHFQVVRLVLPLNLKCQ